MVIKLIVRLIIEGTSELKARPETGLRFFLQGAPGLTTLFLVFPTPVLLPHLYTSGPPYSSPGSFPPCSSRAHSKTPKSSRSHFTWSKRHNGLGASLISLIKRTLTIQMYWKSSSQSGGLGESNRVWCHTRTDVGSTHTFPWDRSVPQCSYSINKVIHQRVPFNSCENEQKRSSIR